MKMINATSNETTLQKTETAKLFGKNDLSMFSREKCPKLTYKENLISLITMVFCIFFSSCLFLIREKKVYIFLCGLNFLLIMGLIACLYFKLNAPIGRIALIIFFQTLVVAFFHKNAKGPLNENAKEPLNENIQIFQNNNSNNIFITIISLVVWCIIIFFTMYGLWGFLLSFIPFNFSNFTSFILLIVSIVMMIIGLL